MIQLILIFAAAVIFSWPQAKSAEEWNTVSQMRGTLARDESPSRQTISKNIGKSPIRLFVRTDGFSCCSGLSPAAGTKTDCSDAFHFEKIVPGKFWLVATIQGSECSLPITYEPSKNLPEACSNQVFTVYKSSEFKLLRVIEVD